jgi:hypothetical protein
MPSGFGSAAQGARPSAGDATTTRPLTRRTAHQAMHPRNVIPIAFLLLLVVAWGCSERGGTSSTTTGGDASAIAVALENMLRRAGDDGFVIVMDESTGTFVQFMGSASESFWLDLPMATLTADERVRAMRLFASLDLTVEEEDFSLMVALERDAGKASEIAQRIFREVFELSEGIELTIIEGR